MAKQKEKTVYHKAMVFYDSPYYVDYRGGGMPPGGFYDLVIKYHGEEKEYFSMQNWPELCGGKGYAMFVDFGGRMSSDEARHFQRDCEDLSDKVLKVELKEYSPSLLRKVLEAIGERF